MYKITCGSYSCSHNMAGGCDAGVVSVRERIGEGPRCETFTVYADDANVTADISPLGFKCYKRRGSITCSMLNCAHLKDGICLAEYVIMQDPAQAGSVQCATYTKETRNENNWT